ncbi:uncharacterized protein LOC100835422 [Brachypodium distachyon]|uniref:non-specific serine/threonine protein kinase n=1 Tax=Brachypodium distachyon TaxID=15368 RepID=I1I2W9_BRADI|nr:uncharacterized protein LOC100835422 [Brachypodium distachyon]KQJ96091.1 hypothetical protein BRADI_3g20930v3 [Brachypodium distachyon]|eukprot:XP_003571656.1 uncharacterized protein LOC100835422 [Brachypodium distachyon]
MELLRSIAVLLLLSCSLAAATAPAGTLERVSKQQILASIPPGGHASPPVPFLTSPSGKYAAYFVRTHTVPGAGGLGADFCYVEVTMSAHGGSEGAAGIGTSVWESECRPVSTVNTCTLLFSWHGLEVFDGSEEVWHGETNTDGTNFLQTLELVDDGDMRVRDKDGELAWRASDEPRHAQRCGAPGSPGLAAALPPFAEPIGAHSSSLPFGQEEGGNGHAAQLPQAAELGDGSVAPWAGGAVGAAPVAAGALGDGYGAAPAAGVAPGEGLGDGYGIAPAAAGVGNYGGAGAVGVAGQGGAVGSAGFGSQPLVDNSPYDSAAWKDGRGAHLSAIGFAVFVSAALGAMAVGL